MQNAIKVFTLLIIFSYAQVSAGPGHKHTHGEANIKIAFEDKEGLIQFTSPSDVIIGFEHAGKNETQKTQIVERLEGIRAKAADLFTLPQDCQIKTLKAERVATNRSGTHSNVEAEFQVKCQSSIKGKKLGINIQYHYTQIKKLEVELTTPSGASKQTLRQMAEVGL